ncbi:hypothetical protein Tco_1204525 [Tanacetum coccineum]
MSPPAAPYYLINLRLTDTCYKKYTSHSLARSRALTASPTVIRSPRASLRISRAANAIDDRWNQQRYTLRHYLCRLRQRRMYRIFSGVLEHLSVSSFVFRYIGNEYVMMDGIDAADNGVPSQTNREKALDLGLFYRVYYARKVNMLKNSPLEFTRSQDLECIPLLPVSCGARLATEMRYCRERESDDGYHSLPIASSAN